MTSEPAMVPFMLPSRSLFLLQRPITNLEEQVPMVPVPILMDPYGKLEPKKSPTRWRLERSGYGQCWQPENSTILSNSPSSSSSSSSSSPFSYNSKSIIPYTDFEYERYLQVEGWSRAETDYLFTKCHDLNNRFVIIADRYDYKGAPLRSIEDLRERYYQVVGKLSKLKNDDTHQFVYDKEGDRHHRLTLETLHLRTPEQLQEEAILNEIMVQARLLLPSILQDREKLLLCCGGGGDLGRNLLSQAQTLPELMGSMTLSRSRKSSISSEAKPAKPKVTNPPTTNRPESNNKKRQSNGTGGPLESTCTTALEADPFDITNGGGSHHGPGRRPKPIMANTLVRSITLRPIRVGLTRHVDKLLQEMGIQHRPILPTAIVVEKFDELRSLLVRLSEAQKNLDSLLGVVPLTGSSSKPESISSRRPSRPTSPSPAATLTDSTLALKSSIPTPPPLTNRTPKRHRKE